MAASETAPQAETVRRILWGALLASVALHAALPSLLSLAPVPAPSPVSGLLLALAVVAAGAALAVHHVALRRPLQAGRLDPADAQQVTTRYVVAWALAEAPAVLGLVRALLSGDPTAGWGPAALSVVVLLVLAPRAAATPPSAALARPDVKIG